MSNTRQSPERDASPKRSVRPSIILYLDGEDQQEMRHILIAPDQYTDEEREMIESWTLSENIITEYDIEDSESSSDSSDSDPAAAARARLAARHRKLFFRLEKLPNMERKVAVGKCVFYHVSIFN